MPLLFLLSVSSQKLKERGCERKVVLSVVEAVPTSSKPPAADVSMRTFTGRRCGLGVSAP